MWMPLPGTWRVMEQLTAWGLPRTLANQNLSFSTEGKGLSPYHKPNLNQPVNKGMSLSLLPINSAPARVAGHLKCFQNNYHLITDGPWVLETIMGYKIVSFYASPGSLASQCHFNSPAGGCSSRVRQNGSARSHPPKSPPTPKGDSSA